MNILNQVIIYLLGGMVLGYFFYRVYIVWINYRNRRNFLRVTKKFGLKVKEVNEEEVDP